MGEKKRGRRRRAAACQSSTFASKVRYKKARKAYEKGRPVYCCRSSHRPWRGDSVRRCRKWESPRPADSIAGRRARFRRRRLEADAASARDWPAAVETAALLARALAFVPRDTAAALARVRAARARYMALAPEETRRLFLAEAEILSQIGDAAGIRSLMSEFRRSPAFDGRPFEYRVKEGHDTPMVIVRPRGGPENSITLTAMGRLLNRAQAAPGSFWPAFEWQDAQGRRVTQADLHGAPALVVFLIHRSPIWERQHRVVNTAWRRYGAAGLRILAVCMNLDGNELREFSRGFPPEWFFVSAKEAGAIAARVGIFGESEIFALDAGGRILARGLEQSEIIGALRQAFGGR